MSDNNRLELVLSIVDENTASATAKARANMRSFVEEAVKAAQGASNSLDKVTVELARSFEKASSSAMSSLDRLEARAALAGKRGVDRLVAEKQLRISALGEDEAAIKRVTAAYDKLITAQKNSGEHGGNGQVLRRTILGVKDFLEGSTRGAIIEGTDILVGTSGSGGILQKAIPNIAAIAGVSSAAVIAVGGLTAAFLGLEFAGIESVRHLAETGEQIKNFSLRTGIAPERVQAFQFAAKAAGQDPNTVEVISREMSRAADDYSPEGVRKRDYLQNKLGVNLFDAVGDLKPTEQIFLDIADGINKLPPGLERTAAMVRIFGERGAEVLPIFEKLRESIGKSDEIGHTFTESDRKMFEEWKQQLVVMDEEWQRFKAGVLKPLAVAATITLQVVNEAVVSKEKSVRAYGSPYASVLEPGINNALGEKSLHFDSLQPLPERPKPPGVPPGLSPYDIALERRAAADALIESKLQSDPEAKRRQIERQLSELGAPIKGRTPLDKAQEYYALQDQLKALKPEKASKPDKSGAEELVAAAKERQQLLAESAQIAQSAQMKQLTASLDSKRELATPSDIDRLMDLAKQRAIADENKAIDERRTTIDSQGRRIDQSGTPGFQEFLNRENENLSQRVENEQAKVLADIAAQDARYFRSRTEADGKAWEESWQRRKRGELELQQDEINIRQQMQSKQFDINGSAIDRQKEMALQGLDGANAQTLKQKIALEDQKFAIEQTYAERSLANQVAKLENEQVLAIAKIREKASADGNAGSPAEAAKIAATRDEYQQQIDAARGATSDREIIDAQKTQAAKEKLQIESSKRVYESLKQDAAGLFDQLVSHTKSWGDFAKDLFKSAILTPVKDIFSSQVAALFTKGLTGQDVSFGEVGNGQGTFGKLGSIFGRAGLGQPQFGSGQTPHKLEQPGHLGDLNLVSGAVPVVLMNAGGSGPVRASSGSGGFSLGSLLGLGGVLGTAASAAPSSAEQVTSTISYATGGSETFSSLANLVGGPGGTSGFAGPVAGYGGSAGGSSGFGGILSNLGGLFGGGSSGTDLGNGVGIANSGVLGRLAAFGKSGGAALLGGSVALDGIRRGGIGGTLEAAGGGALVGFKYGGPVGALIGAAIGGGIAGFKSIFGTSDRQHAKDLVKQVYGMDVNNATADQIVQIAKQAYGGQIDVAVRSPQVRDLLKLYAQTVGNKSAQDQFVQSQVHSASFVENGGKLQQQAVYDNGSAYSYSSPLSVYGGVQTSPLSTFAPNQGVFNGNLQINLNGQSASDALAGQVVRVATPGFVQGQALAASNSSIGRTAQQNMTLSPSALRS